MTVPTRHHHSHGHLPLAIAATALMAVLFLLFERAAMWVAGVVVLIALLPVLPNDWSRREKLWRVGVAVSLVAVAVLIWLT